MKRFTLATVFACSIAAVTCWAQTAVARADARAESKASSSLEQRLIDNVKELAAASQRNDGDYFKRTLADDFMAVPKNGGTIDRADFLEDILGADKTQESKQPWLYNIKVIPLSEGAALITYDEILPEEDPRYRHVSDIWIKQGEQWKLKFQQTTPNLWSIGD
jgi:hypothetical protein